MSRPQFLIVIAALLTQVLSLTARTDAQTNAPTVRDPGEVKKTFEEVLADPEFRHLHRTGSGSDSETRWEGAPDWWQDFWKWLFGEPKSRDASIQSSGEVSVVLTYVLLGVVAVGLLVVLILVLKSRDPLRTDGVFGEEADDEEAIVPSRPPGDIAVNVYERRALAAAERGDYRSALRELVLGSMSWTERAGLIRHRRGLTNRDYVRAIWRHVERRDSLARIVVAFERVFYGRRAADATAFDACLVEFQKSFRTEVTDAAF